MPLNDRPNPPSEAVANDGALVNFLTDNNAGAGRIEELKSVQSEPASADPGAPAGDPVIDVA